MEKEVILDESLNDKMNDEVLHVEKMRYQTNGISYLLGMLAVFLSVFAAFILLNSSAPKTSTLFKILYNIAILLFGFMACEKVKNYSRPYSYVMFALAGINVARIFWIPVQLMVKYAEWSAISAEKADIMAIAENSRTAAQTARLSELSTLITTYTDYLGKVVIESTNSLNYLPRSGIFRGLFAIILLILSATCFAFAGFIAYKKSKLLTNYLASIEQV